MAATVITPAGYAVPNLVQATHASWSAATFHNSSPSVACPYSPHPYGVQQFSTDASHYAGGITERFDKPDDAAYKRSHNFVAQEMWLWTNGGPGGGPTWVEAGYTNGVWSGGTWKGAFWARQNSIGYAQFKMLTSGIYPNKSTSYYDFHITEMTSAQTSFTVSASVINKSGTQTAFKSAPTYHQPTNDGKAHSAWYGIEATCSYDISHTSGTWAVSNGQSASVRSQGTWRHFPHHKGPYYAHEGTGNPFSVRWYPGYTGVKIVASMASKT